jgi:exodeoxyribonuclease VII large subunit
MPKRPPKQSPGSSPGAPEEFELPFDALPTTPPAVLPATQPAATSRAVIQQGVAEPRVAPHVEPRTSRAKSSRAERELYTPSRLNREARALLERGFASLWIEGEVSNFSRPSSGHWYFSLKDAEAQLRCAMFRQRNVLIRFTPKDGMHVQMRGRVTMFEPRGEYQFLVDFIEEAGEGELRRRFDELKTKLAAEGLFAPEHKRPLPKLPRRIGVVTSESGAALRDILHILRRRFCSIPVLIYPVQVQGPSAGTQIAHRLRVASARKECDVLILARGGGSLEDLWAFNEEVVARAIYESGIPIVSGIGHEVDFTIADFVADVRAPTPSGAAEIVAPDCNDWLRNVMTLGRRLTGLMQRRIATQRDRFTWLTRRLAQVHPGVELRREAQRLDDLEQRLLRAMRHGLAHRRGTLNERSASLRHASPALRVSAARGRLEVARGAIGAAVRRRVEVFRGRLAVAVGALDVVSPLATLQRGYAIVTDADGHVVTHAAHARVGTTIDARVASGTIRARVEAIRSPDDQDST